MTRDELIEAMARAIAVRRYWDFHRGPLPGDFFTSDSFVAADEMHGCTAEATSALSVLTPLLKRVAEGLEPFYGVSAKAKGSDDACWCGQDGSVIRYRDLRTASALHQELKGMLS